MNQIEPAVHALKSNVANIGAEILSGSCMQLEELGSGNQFMWQLALLSEMRSEQTKY